LDAERQRDDEHLHLLAVFHYVYAAITALTAAFALLLVLIGGFFLATPPSAEAPPPAVGWAFIWTGIVGVALGWAYAALVFVAGRFIAAQRGYVYVLVVSVLNLLFTPLGTVLGVFTLVVLARSSVKRTFEASRLSRAATPVRP